MLIRNTLLAADITNYNQHQDVLFDYEQPWKRVETLADGRICCWDRLGCLEVSFFAYLVSPEDAGTSLSHLKTMTVDALHLSTHGTTDTVASFRVPTFRSSRKSHIKLQPPSIPDPICYSSVMRNPGNLRAVASETRVYQTPCYSE